MLVKFPVNGTRTQGYLAVPEAGAGPGVLVLQEWWGLVDHIKEICDRLAEAGFTALAPDMYHGDCATDPDEAGRLMMALDGRSPPTYTARSTICATTTPVGARASRRWASVSAVSWRSTARARTVARSARA